MSISSAILFVAAMLALAVYYRKRLFAEEADYDTRWLLLWAVKGIALPAVAWAMLNMGNRPVLPALQPLAPPASPGWFGWLIYQIQYVTAQTSPALFVISSFWAALTLAWFVSAAAWRAEDREGFAISCLVWCGLLLPVVALMTWICGPTALGLAALFWFWPLAHYASSLRKVDPVPIYGRAVAKMKFGKYREAEQAIIRELEKCQTDFDGWLMLAELYATKFHDLPEAELTIRELCDDPATTPSQMAVALHRLADWQLQLRGDPVAARRALRKSAGAFRIPTSREWPTSAGTSYPLPPPRGRNNSRPGRSACRRCPTCWIRAAPKARRRLTARRRSTWPINASKN